MGSGFVNTRPYSFSKSIDRQSVKASGQFERWIGQSLESFLPRVVKRRNRSKGRRRRDENEKSTRGKSPSCISTSMKASVLGRTVGVLLMRTKRK